MNNQATCAGCYTQQNNWFEYSSSYTPTATKRDDIGLTENEKIVLAALADAWGKFITLNEKHPDHNNEFRDAIHRCQHIIAIRVAQRVNPEIWYVPVASPQENESG